MTRMDDTDQKLISTRPYLIRAMRDWALDNGLTPQLLVDASFGGVEVPPGYIEDGKIVLKMKGQEIQSDQVLVAAGAWSHQLASQLGVRIPLETERGYHVTLNSTEGGPTNIVMESKHKFMATPMEMGVRFAGTAEFAGLNSPANEARAKTLLKLGKMMYPNLEKGESSELFI